MYLDNSNVADVFPILLISDQNAEWNKQWLHHYSRANKKPRLNNRG
jgi:hypothetical protein